MAIFQFGSNVTTRAINNVNIELRDDNGVLLDNFFGFSLITWDYLQAAPFGAGGDSLTDELIAGSGNNLIFWDWETVSDSLHPGPVAGRYFLPAGNATSAIEIFRLGDGNDILNLTYDTIAGGVAYGFSATAYGGSGNDLIMSGSLADQLFGDEGADTVFGGGGNDIIDLRGSLAESFDEFGYGGSGKKATAAEIWFAFKDAAWGLMTPVIILGGIYGGVFTPTEAAGVAAVYGLFVGFVVYKELTLVKLKKLLIDASVGSAVVMLIVSSASLFAWLITTEGAAQMASAAMLAFTKSTWVILLIINILVLIAGCFLDAISIFYILLPIFLPIIKMLNVDPVLFGVMLTVNVAIGQITPPVGVNLYVACNIADLSLTDISKAIMPFLIASTVALLLITYIPALSLWLPKVLGM